MTTRRGLVGLGLIVLAIMWLIYNETSTIGWYDDSTRIIDSKSKPGRVPPGGHRASTSTSCSAQDMDKVKKHFTAKKIAEETRCPDSTTWWTKYLNEIFFPLEYNNNDGRPLVAISLGCNKGDDAVATLRQMTRSNDVSVTNFRQTFAQHASQLNEELRQKSHGTLIGKTPLKRACPDYPQPPLVIDNEEASKKNLQKSATDVTVHCVEAMPTTAWILQQTANTFDWRDQFVLTHAAVGPRDGSVNFPTAYAGIEHLGLSDCQQQNGNNERRKSASCQSVPAFTVDTFVREKVIKRNAKLVAAAKADQSVYAAILAQSVKNGDGVAWDQYNPNFVIDFLAVDVEGYDWQVLGQGGADWTLHHTRYLEFEYHATGAWQQDQLSVAIETLDTHFGFTCYWAGVRKLIRITNCFQPYMEFHQWSNIACANRHLQPHLAAEMEKVYQETLVKLEE